MPVNRWPTMAMGLPFLLLAGALAQAQQPQVASPTRNLRPVTDGMLRNPPASDWLMWRRTYNAWGYSPLDQINKDNVKNLQVAWTWSMINGATETTPIVHDGVLYLFNYANAIQALDGATGDLIWEYKRDLPAKLVADAGNLSSRNMAIYEDKLIAATADAHLIALDLKSGKLVWDDATADWTKGWRHTSGPFVAGGTIVQGMQGCGNAQPGGCFITGHDPKTGAEKWRVYTIAHPGDPNENSWNGLPLESRFGATPWGAGSYDPDLNLVFFGTGQPYPWIAEMRGTVPRKEGFENNALYSDSTLAIEPDTGKLRWYRQHLQDDTWDLDYVYERLLIDLPVNGETRKALVTAGKLGILEVIDRSNGQWLWHKEMVPQNVVAAIDAKTGEKTINAAITPRIGQPATTCPANPGARGCRRARSVRKADCSTCRSTSSARRSRPSRSIPVRPIPAAGARFSNSWRHPPPTATLAVSTRSGSPTARRSGRTASGRPRPARFCRLAAASCSRAISGATSGHSTRRRARCCGKSAPTMPSIPSRSATA